MTNLSQALGAIKPKLYHAPSSYYSMIARLALVEGRISFEPVFVDIHARMIQQRPEYVRLNPSMTVPTLSMPGRVIGQSRDIAEFAMGIDVAAVDPDTKHWLDLHLRVFGRGADLRRLPVRSAICAFHDT